MEREQQLQEEKEAELEKKSQSIKKTPLSKARTDEDGEEESDEDNLKAMFQRTSKSILKEIDKYRMLEGTILLKKIAKRYGLRIKVLGPQESDDKDDDQVENEEDEEDEEEEIRPKKKVKVTSSSFTKLSKSTPPVKVKRVSGAIGYKSAIHGK